MVFMEGERRREGRSEPGTLGTLRDPTQTQSPPSSRSRQVDTANAGDGVMRGQERRKW